MNRRQFLASASALAPLTLAACASGSAGAVALATAQSWASITAAALESAAAAYTGAGAADAQGYAAQLEVATSAFVALGDVSSAHLAALSWIDLAAKLSPMVSKFIDPEAAKYVPIALAVVRAFVQSLPMPADAPDQPPASLVRAGVRRR